MQPSAASTRMHVVTPVLRPWNQCGATILVQGTPGWASAPRMAVAEAGSGAYLGSSSPSRPRTLILEFSIMWTLRSVGAGGGMGGAGPPWLRGMPPPGVTEFSTNCSILSKMPGIVHTQGLHNVHVHRLSWAGGVGGGHRAGHDLHAACSA